MTYLRISMVIFTLCVTVASVWHIYSILHQVLRPCDMYIIAVLFMAVIVSTEFGLFALSMLVSDYRSKKIQKELDIERSFRKLGGDI